MSLRDIAHQLKGLDESIILIYAFNATGKTRLSVAYKDETKDPETGQHAGVYYNAFSEDLFVWDNDEENNGANVQLTILPSRLNDFHSFLYENPDMVMENLAMYFPKYTFEFVRHDNPEDGIQAVVFRLPTGGPPIKISRGEERIFVWCFFLALLEVDGWADEQDAHIFIDDPVSSLDEHNIYVTAETIFGLIEKHFQKKRLIVTTHHIGLFSILADRLTKGSKSDRFKRITALRLLTNRNATLQLEKPRDGVFLFHLHLLRTLVEVPQDKLYLHHAVLLRQALESVSSFLGVGSIEFVLTQIGVEDPEGTANTINSLSHKDAYYHQADLMSPAIRELFQSDLAKLNAKYNFVLHAETAP